MGRRTNVRRLAVEALEERFLLAGNVTAAFKSGDLVVRGDARDNQIVITQPAAGRLRVTGLEGTTINGRGSFELPGRANDVELRLQQGGTDQIAILGAIDVPGHLRARLGGGTFLLDGSSGPVRIGEDLRVRSGRNGDMTIRNDVRVAGDTAIEAGGTVHVVAGQAALLDFRAARFSDSLSIDNPYFPLVVGTTYTYEVAIPDDAGGEVVTERIVVEVLLETRTIEGVVTQVVRDRVWRQGLLIEDTFDWYAQDDNGNVWYFGEDVTNFEYNNQGALIGTNRSGSWVTGVNDAKAGIIMEANPRVGDNYYQEFAPAVELAPATVLDQGKVLATNETTTVPAGTFRNVVRTEDTTAVEPDHLANKFYAPGLGSIREFDYDYLTGEVSQITRLVSAQLNGQKMTQVVPPAGFVGANVTGPVTRGIRFDGPAGIRARDSVIVRGTEFNGNARIFSRLDVAAIESVFAQRAWIGAEETVSLRNVSADQRIQIGSDGDVYLFDSAFHAEVRIRLGASDNTLSLVGSEIGSLDADGGPGQNTFEDRGGNVIHKLRLRRFFEV